MNQKSRSADRRKRIEVTLDSHTICMQLPSDEEASLEDAVAGKCVDPYWGKLWDAAHESASCVLRHQWPAKRSALELGCGAGMVGIAGLMAGLEVTFSDHEPQAIELAVENAALNGFEKCDKLLLEWAQPIDRKFDFILASDILYEQTSHELILNLAEAMLNDDGKLFIGDPGRRLVRNFISSASSIGWRIKIVDGNLQEIMVPPSNQFLWIEVSK